MGYAIRVRNEQAQSVATAVSFHLNEIPAFVEDELQRLYGHIHSSLPYFRVFKSADQVITYVAWHGTTPTAVLLFRLGKRSIEVLNEKMRIDEGELRRFAAAAFKRFPLVGVIRFEAVQTDLQNFPYPVQQNEADENFMITLPATPQDYKARLGKATRRNIKRYLGKFLQDYPSFRFQTYEKKGIDEQLIRDIIKLSEARIMAKKLKFKINDENIERIIKLAKLCGVVNTIQIYGRLCAGTISYRVGANQLARIIAHDSRYNAYWPGTLCYYLTICESITKGVRSFHMGKGEYDYKFRLLGIRQDMSQLVIYSSFRKMMLNCDWAAKTWINARIRRTKIWLLNRPTSLMTRFLLKAQYVVRRLKKES